jgi:hypothetical protein
VVHSDKEMPAELVPLAMVGVEVVVPALLEPQTQEVQLVVLGYNGQMEPTMLEVEPEHLVDLLPAAVLAVVDLVLVALVLLTAQQIPGVAAAPTGHILTVLKPAVVDQE